MPIVGPVFQGILMTQFTAQGFTGSKLIQLSSAIGNGVANYLLASAIYQGTAVGIGVGAGVGTGTVQGIIGPVTSTNIMTMMTAVGFTGAKTFQMATAIGNGFSAFIATGIVTSASAGVAAGTGIGKLIVVGPAMAASILTMFTAVGFAGAKTPLLASAIGNGICNTILSTGIVVTAIVGAGFPPTPMTGVDTGKLF
jgi:hypothetical protein